MAEAIRFKHFVGREPISNSGLKYEGRFLSDTLLNNLPDELAVAILQGISAGCGLPVYRVPVEELDQFLNPTPQARQ